MPFVLQTHGTLRLAECDVCGTLAEVTTLAEGRTIRNFTAEEKQRYLEGFKSNSV